MPIFRGTNNIKKIFRGNNEIVKVFRGTNLIFQSFQFPQYEELADITLTSNQSQIVISGLNIGKMENIKMSYSIDNNTTSRTNAFIYVNNQTTASNYKIQRHTSSTTSTVSAERFNEPRFTEVANGKSNGFIDINISQNDRFIVNGYALRNIGTTSALDYRMMNISSDFTVSSINTLTIAAANVGQFSAGTRIQLYKVVQ